MHAPAFRLARLAALAAAALLVVFTTPNRHASSQTPLSWAIEDTRSVRGSAHHEGRRQASDSDAAPGLRSVVVTLWTVRGEPQGGDQCRAAFEGASGFLQQSLRHGPLVSTLLLHNTGCDVQALFGPSLSSLSIVVEGRYHIFDERWMWYRRLLDAVDVANQHSTLMTWPRSLNSTATGPLWANTSMARSQPGIVAPITHVMFMDARDSLLLRPPGTFFQAYSQYDLFIGEEAADNSNVWMVERYKACSMDPLPFLTDHILNAGVVGGTVAGMSWLADRVIEELHQAEARAGLPCTSLGIDMVLVNKVLRLNATASGMATWTGEPFTPTYKHARYIVYANYSAGLGLDGGLPVPTGWHTPASCGCAYPGGPVGKYGDNHRVDHPAAAVTCNRCIPYLAMHKARPVFRK